MGYKSRFTTIAESIQAHHSGWAGVKCKHFRANRVITTRLINLIRDANFPPTFWTEWHTLPRSVVQVAKPVF